MTDKDDKTKQLEVMIAGIEKQFGKGTILRPKGKPPERASIPTGSLQLDRALGIGGFPTDGTIEIFGPESVGKTTLALSAMANAQKIDDRKCMYIDMENALDLNYAEAIGVKTEDILFVQPEWGEQAMEIAYRAIISGTVSMVVVDSIAALIPRAELDGTFEDKHMANIAQLLTYASHKFGPATRKNNVLLVFLNQVRVKMGIVYGNPEDTPGGKAIRHLYLQRIGLHRKGDVKDKDGFPCGVRIEAKIFKNKTGDPLKKIEYEILYGKGINQFAEVIDLGVRFGLIDKTSAAWFEYKGQKINGRDKLIEFFASDLDEFEILKKEITTC